MGAFPTDITDKDAYIAELEAEVERLLAETCVLAERLVEQTGDALPRPGDAPRGPGDAVSERSES